MTKKPSKKSKISKTELEQQVAELTANLQRLQAEFENYRKRAEQEQFRAINIGKESVVTVLIPTIDNIDRALNNAPKDLKDNEYVQGVKNVAKQLNKSLADIGVYKIESVGAEFDPELMEAVVMEDGKGKKEIVSEELQAGYVMGDTVIRHAMVKVTKKG